MSGKDEEQALPGRVAQRRFAPYRKRSPFRLAAAAAIFVLSTGGSAPAAARVFINDQPMMVYSSPDAAENMVGIFIFGVVACLVAARSIPDLDSRRQVRMCSLVFLAACAACFGLPGLLPHCPELLDFNGNIVGDCRDESGLAIIGASFALPLLIAGDVKLLLAQRLKDNPPAAAPHRVASAIFFALGLAALLLPALAALGNW